MEDTYPSRHSLLLFVGILPVQEMTLLSLPLLHFNRHSTKASSPSQAPSTDKAHATTMGEHLRTQFHDYFLGTRTSVNVI